MLVDLLFFFSIIFLVLAIVSIVYAIFAKEFGCISVGIFSILFCLLLFLGAMLTTGSTEWVLKEEAFLASVSDNCYLLEGETNYIYNDEHTQIEVITIASTEEPYVLKYERTVDGDKECKYVFYIPQS